MGLSLSADFKKLKQLNNKWKLPMMLVAIIDLGYVFLNLNHKTTVWQYHYVIETSKNLVKKHL